MCIYMYIYVYLYVYIYIYIQCIYKSIKNIKMLIYPNAYLSESRVVILTQGLVLINSLACPLLCPQ